MNINKLSLALASVVTLSFGTAASAISVGDFEDSLTSGTTTWSVADGSYVEFDGVFSTSGNKSLAMWSARDPNAPGDGSFASDLGLTAADFLADSFAGSAIFSDFSFLADVVFSFDFQFDTFDDILYGNDYGFLSIVDTDTNDLLQLSILADVQEIFDTSAVVEGSLALGLDAGNYRVGFGVMNNNDYVGDSLLLVDNVQVNSVSDATNTLLLLGLSGLSLFSIRRFIRA